MAVFTSRYWPNPDDTDDAHAEIVWVEYQMMDLGTQMVRDENLQPVILRVVGVDEVDLLEALTPDESGRLKQEAWEHHFYEIEERLWRVSEDETNLS